MSAPVSVSLSGPAFSFLLYENSKCQFQQEGFLLGEIIHNETKTITDNDQQQINITKTIKVNSIMPCPHPHYFYNGIGEIDRAKIEQFLGNQFDKVIAWYKYQRTANFKFTMRDKIIHSQLTKFFKIPPEIFTTCLLINEVSDNGSTHLYSQAFMRFHNNRSDRVPIHIPNLSEPNNTYRDSEVVSDTFNQILKGLKIDRKNTQGLTVINKIQNAVQKHVDTMIEKLSEAEQHLYALEEEVKVSRAKKMEARKLEMETDEMMTSDEDESSIWEKRDESVKKYDSDNERNYFSAERGNSSNERGDFKIERANIRIGRGDFKTERGNSSTEQGDTSTERDDLSVEQGDSSFEMRNSEGMDNMSFEEPKKQDLLRVSRDTPNSSRASKNSPRVSQIDKTSKNTRNAVETGAMCEDFPELTINVTRTSLGRGRGRGKGCGGAKPRNTPRRD